MKALHTWNIPDSEVEWHRRRSMRAKLALKKHFDSNIKSRGWRCHVPSMTPLPKPYYPSSFGDVAFSRPRRHPRNNIRTYFRHLYLFCAGLCNNICILGGARTARRDFLTGSTLAIPTHHWTTLTMTLPHQFDSLFDTVQIFKVIQGPTVPIHQFFTTDYLLDILPSLDDKPQATDTSAFTNHHLSSQPMVL